jgi:hypothetical protein
VYLTHTHIRRLKENQWNRILTNMTIGTQRYTKLRPKAGIVEPERTSIAEQRFVNYVSSAANSNKRVHC